MSTKQVVWVDEHGRFLGTEGHNGSYDFKEHHSKQRDPDWYDWNVKTPSTIVSAIVCRQCRIAKLLLVQCANCSQKLYCSHECCAKDGMHAAECIGPRHGATRMHSRFPRWVRAYRHAPFYRPQLYRSYRKWAPASSYTIIRQGLAPLPSIAPETTSDQIEEELRLLQDEHENMRRMHSVEIMPDPAYGRYVWVRTGAPRPEAN